MEATNQPTPVILSEAEVDEVAEMFPHAEYQPDVEAMPLCAFCDGAIDDHKANCVVPHVHALCATVRALRQAQQPTRQVLETYLNDGEQSPPGLHDLAHIVTERLHSENTDLREQLAEARTENERLAAQLKEWQEEKDTKAGYL